MKNTTLRGISTISFYAENLEAARKWYTDFLGIEPYFSVPGYIEFRIGDYQHELGIIESRYAPHDINNAPSGSIVYWHVDDIKSILEKLISMGATIHQQITDRGHGFITASVIDPFGNIIGIMYNPHYIEVFNEKK